MTIKKKINKFLVGFFSILTAIISISSGTIFAFTENDFSCAEQGGVSGTCFYDPDEDCSISSSAATTSNGVTINNNAAEQIAEQYSKDGVNVGYALYNSNNQLLANYNDTFENYGASITKAMVLVAYLNQLGSGSLSSSAKTNLEGMIEDSINQDANNVIGLLNNPSSEINAVAARAGMTGFKFNITSDAIYHLGQSQITARDFAKFFSVIDTMFPASQKSFALNLLSNISQKVGLLKANLPGTVYSKEGWKEEPDGASDPAISGSQNPFGDEGSPWVVNQAAQFSSSGTTYGIAVTVGGANLQGTGESIIQKVASALVTTNSGSSGTTTTTTTTSLSGNSNQEKIYNYFISKGLTSIEAAGIDGNFGQESNYNPYDSGGYLAQWSTASGLAGLAALAQKEGQPITSLGVQLDYVWQGLNGDFKSVLANLKNASNVSGAVNAFMGPNNLSGNPVAVTDPSQRSGGYEDPGTPDGAKRLQYAENTLSLYGGGSSGTSSNGCSSTSSVNCTSATGNAKILCEAKQYQGIYYEYGGGHQGYKSFVAGCPDPSNPPDNQPYGGPTNGDKSGNPGPCGLDCSGLVSVAVDEAFNLDYMWAVKDYVMQGNGGNNYWQHIPLSQVKTGDIVTLSSHVEIVDYVSGGTVYTFGTRATGETASEVHAPLSSWDDAYRWTGPGSD